MKAHHPDSTGVDSMLACVIRVFGGLAALAALVVFTSSDGIRAPLVSLIQAASADEYEKASEQQAEEVVEIESIITEEDDNLNTATGTQAEDATDVAAPTSPSYNSEEEAEDIGVPVILTEEDDEEPPVDVDPPRDNESE